MSSLLGFFESEFNTQQEQWENALKAELKIPEIGNKAQKSLMSGGSWPTLSLSGTPVHVKSSLPWKKASTTYASLENIEASISEDLSFGVRNFFFYQEALNPAKWQKIEKLLGAFEHASELEVFILGESANNYVSSRFTVISHLMTGGMFHDLGGHSIQELGLLASRLVEEKISEDVVYLGVYLDSQFFHNIAKIRATKLLAQKIFEELGVKKTFRVVGLTSYREWTLFERYSNMLRNETALASAYIGGADHIQSAGYNTILELEVEGKENLEHYERSQRMARNTAHVLALESMLGVVEDAAYGSFHLENLTQSLAEESWKVMQTLVGLKGNEKKSYIEKESTPIREKRLLQLKTRKYVMSGLNDYPDVKEKIEGELRMLPSFRLGRVFEELRLKMQNLKQKPSVYIALYGDYAALNARLNFVKNYFELLGLTVEDYGHSELDLEHFKANLQSRKDEIIVLCSSDDKYPELLTITHPSAFKYVAGKVEVPGYKNLFAGQNVYEILHDLVSATLGRSV